MIRSAIRYGLDAIVFTDHHRLVPPQRLAELNEKYAPFRIFGGIELNVAGEDFLVLGVPDPALERSSWRYPELHAFVRDAGGLLILAHPFRYHDGVQAEVHAYPPDAVELHSMNTGACDEADIRLLRESLRCRFVCNSDAHAPAHVGIYYNELERSPEDEAELVAILKAGQYRLRAMKDRIAAMNRRLAERRALVRRMVAEDRAQARREPAPEG